MIKHFHISRVLSHDLSEIILILYFSQAALMNSKHCADLKIENRHFFTFDQFNASLLYKV